MHYKICGFPGKLANRFFRDPGESDQMPSPTPDSMQQRDIFTVSRLNSEVRSVLEGSFPLLWVEGEISNLARPSSGHIYFSLKDPAAQVRCAMFRMKRQRLRFQPENGQQVLIRARVGLYEARGEFQLVVEHMEPAGAGALQQAFEELKRRLAAEGLFDTDHKQPLPLFPRRIGVITSPAGAAIQDILRVLRHRFPAIPVVVYPVPVQGADAPGEIAEMVRLADRRAECDLLILARGGGSIEDLMAFNDEQLARAIYQARLPIVSAVGHEIDFTIADFVADRRAATPSAAAEMVSPDQAEVTRKLDALERRLGLQMRQQITHLSLRLENPGQRLLRCHPGSRLLQQQQRLDELEQRLAQGVRNQQRRIREHLSTLSARIQAHTPAHRLQRLQQRCDQLRQQLAQLQAHRVQRLGQRVAATAGSLHALSPLATLERGYSITRRLPGREVLLDATEVHPGDQVETLLARGVLLCRVERSRF
jgi:exodeoxyribonuclease VII large subunit